MRGCFLLAALIISATQLLSCGGKEGTEYVCTCSITFNGVTGSWEGCGEQSCVNGRVFVCEADGPSATGTCKADAPPTPPSTPPRSVVSDG